VRRWGALALRTPVTSGVFLLTVGFAFRDFGRCELSGFSELITLVFADAIAVRNFPRTCRVVSKGCASIQGGKRNQNKERSFHIVTP
jgi:hypothetical protein